MKVIDCSGHFKDCSGLFRIEYTRDENGHWYYLKDFYCGEIILLCRQDVDIIWAAYESLQRAAVEDAARSTPFVNIIWKYDRLLNAFVEVPQDDSK